MKRNRFRSDVEVIAPTLAGDLAFTRVEIEMYTGDGSAYLTGVVPKEADRARLRDRMHELFGSSRAAELMRLVSAVATAHNTAPPPSGELPAGNDERINDR